MVPLAQLFEVRRSRAAKTKLDRDVGVGRAAKDLQREGLIHARLPFFKKCACSDSAFAIPPSAVPKLTPTRCLRIFARPIEAGVGERELRRADGKLRITIEPLQSMGRKEFLRRPIRNFRRAMRVEDRAVERFPPGECRFSPRADRSRNFPGQSRRKSSDRAR